MKLKIIDCNDCVCRAIDFRKRKAQIQYILECEGYGDWKIKDVGDAGNLTVFKTKELWMNKKHKRNLFWVLHEVAHIKYPTHDNQWANHYTKLLAKYIL